MLDDPSLQSLYPHDPAKAGQLLDQAGWTTGSDGIRAKNGQRLEFALNAIDYGGGPDQANELIQGQLRQARHGRQDQGPGAATLVRGQLQVRQQRHDAVPASGELDG